MEKSSAIYTTYPTVSPISENDIYQRTIWEGAASKIRPLNICPVCGERMKKLVCDECGYDITKEYEAYMTLELLMDGMPSTLSRRMEYQGPSRKSPIKKDVNIGDIIEFGSYPQTKEGFEKPIEWRVLDISAGNVLVQSVYGLDAKPYNTEWVDITWEHCTLRGWLNHEFLEQAFDQKEREAIITSIVRAEKNPEYDTNPGNDTKDKVFLLSIGEAEKYYASDEERKCKPTSYAEANGAYIDSDTKCSYWWLRSPGDNSRDAACVYRDGSLDFGGDGVYVGGIVVRPALWIHL